MWNLRDVEVTVGLIRPSSVHTNSTTPKLSTVRSPTRQMLAAVDGCSPLKHLLEIKSAWDSLAISMDQPGRFRPALNGPSVSTKFKEQSAFHIPAANPASDGCNSAYFQQTEHCCCCVVPHTLTRDRAKRRRCK
mmetsp:Transcript_59020/g.156566  ORF Transcript_59020/g.156566 Transcript_59020/m.156566 type:complete len:134 (+) Transcript_59020:1741-2142(+)